MASEGGSRFSEAQLVCLLLGLLRYPPGTPDRNRHIAAMIPGNHHPEAIARIIAQPATLILREGNLLNYERGLRSLPSREERETHAPW